MKKRKKTKNNNTSGRQSFYLIIILLPFIFCDNPFKTREAEEPQGTSITFFQPTSPDIVFSNLITAIRKRNSTNYIKCFNLNENISFNFIPETSALENYRAALDFWNINKERTYITNLFFALPEDSLSNLYLERVQEYILADTAIFVKNYTLQVHHTESSLPQEFKGRLEFNFSRLESGLWVISRWVDYRTEESPVWSELKANFIF